MTSWFVVARPKRVEIDQNSRSTDPANDALDDKIQHLPYATAAVLTKRSRRRRGGGVSSLAEMDWKKNIYLLLR
jgi:hypothetical protein